jgi:hypothetical protein
VPGVGHPVLSLLEARTLQRQQLHQATGQAAREHTGEHQQVLCGALLAPVLGSLNHHGLPFGQEVENMTVAPLCDNTVSASP